MTIHDPIAVLLGPWSWGLGIGSILLRLALAALLATVVGWERSSKRHSAGLRTFILITAGSTAAMLLDCCLSPDGGKAFHLLPAAVVIGVSTICVNSLLFSAKNRIRGLTTAAALWCCGIIGLALGAGFYTVGLLVFLVLLPAFGFLSGVLADFLINRRFTSYLILAALALLLTAFLQAAPLWIFHGAEARAVFSVAALQAVWSLPMAVLCYFAAKALAGREREEAQRWKN